LVGFFVLGQFAKAKCLGDRAIRYITLGRYGQARMPLLSLSHTILTQCHLINKTLLRYLINLAIVISIRLVVVLCLLFLGTSVSAQITKHRNTTPSEVRTTTKELAKRITKNRRTDTEKARALFTWIAKHIAYDHELRHNPELQKKFYASKTQLIQQVVSRKKALCGGYAFLFSELCAQLNIESKVIHGYSKKYGNQKSIKKQPDHSWNAVRLDGTWYLLDITYARSHAKGSEPDMYWFKTNPAYFVYTHYPQDPKWMLLEAPISRARFESLP
jgi:transglutaminase/protease-like cytokinesis protein 3